ncbi:MAG: T9SS type A sorting domain-containing protein [Bacteroidetes bacterium]|nr:T9SS type A sorting domain-containing protein [Fibrella sp.]
MKKILMLFSWLTLIGFAGSFSSAIAQTGGNPLRITYPQSRAVFQRNNDNTSTIYVSGSLYQPADSIQARLSRETPGQGTPTEWTTIQRNPVGGIFQGAVRGTGGWYQLEVRAFSGGVILGGDVMRRVGIGEVFIITGQSNAQGFQEYGAVGATDDRVNCVSYDNITASALGDPPAPAFQQLTATSTVGPRGQSAWCWGVLGDLIAKQFQVPVLFINTAWSGTTSRNWVESSNGQQTVYWFNNAVALPTGMPYSNLVVALRYYCSLQGLRAVLWQQGENDNYPVNVPRAEYRNNMQYLINKTRSDTRRYPAWILARTSYNDGRTSADIVGAQTDVINTFNNNVYQGPSTDTIQVPRAYDSVHFGDDGLKRLAQSWYASMNAVFFASSIPLLPLPQPTLMVACSPTNDGLTLSLPGALKSYEWKSGQKTQTLTVTQPGLYQATLKDEFGNTFLSPAVEVIGSIRPTTPTINLTRSLGQVAGLQEQICADSTLTLVANVEFNAKPLWSIGTSNRTISVGTAGTYSLRAVNAYGCQSAASRAVNLIVRSKLPPPVIERVGAYSIQATLPATVDNPRYTWLRAGELIPPTSSVIKVTTSGLYGARAQGQFSLISGGNPLTCYSPYSAPFDFVSNLNDGGLSIYPNPSPTGAITLETIEDLQNAQVDVYTLNGQLLYSALVPIFNERKLVDLTNLNQGEYILRVKTADFETSRRVLLKF